MISSVRKKSIIFNVLAESYALVFAVIYQINEYYFSTVPCPVL